MGQCVSHRYTVEEDAAASVSPRPLPERVEKKKGRFFRRAFSRKSKKTSTEAQQSQCRNDSSQPSERCSDDEDEQINDIDDNLVYSWHTSVSSLTSVQDTESLESLSSLEQSEISTLSSSSSLTVLSTTEEERSASTSGDVSWKNEDEIIRLSLKGKKGDVLQHYQRLELLGRGWFGSVYEGIRLSDSRKVALKFVLKTKTMEKIQINRFGKRIPTEVAMMILMNKGPSVPQIIKLLDWYETPEQYVLVLERPTPCEDLREFLLRKGCRLKESTTRVVMRQVITAARICTERAVLHDDIKLDNLLINPNTLQVKLIDFGVSKRLKKSPDVKLSGTTANSPEFFRHHKYESKPATVYSLGLLLCKMLSGKNCCYTLTQMFDQPWFTKYISKECRDLISSCMDSDPDKRINLDKIILHDWFQVACCSTFPPYGSTATEKPSLRPLRCL